MGIDEIRRRSLEYAQRPSLTPTEWAQEKKKQSEARRKHRIFSEPQKKQDRRRRKYEVYLKGPHWKEMRAKILALRDFKCEQCGAQSNLHVHHVNYSRVGNEKPKDLLVLCKDCHEKQHGMFRFRIREKNDPHTMRLREEDQRLGWSMLMRSSVSGRVACSIAKR